MEILVLLGMYFDVVVVFVMSQTLLFRLALAVLWCTVISSLDEILVRYTFVHRVLRTHHLLSHP